MKNDPDVNITEQCTPFAEQVEILFLEAEMAVKWQRPSILFAVYQSESVRTLAETALEHKLTTIGQTVLTIHAKQVQHIALVDLISKTDDLENTIFFIDGLKWECNLEGANVIKEINKQREYFIDASIRAIFWLKEDEVTDFATNATECWILRHRVVDFTDTPKAEDILLSAIESVWESNPATSENDFPLPSLSELLDFHAGPEMDIHYASNLLTLGILCWRKGEAQAGLKLLCAAQEIAELHQDNVLIAKAENSIGLIHASLGDVDNAIAAYTKSKELLSGAKINWKIFGFLLYKRERYEEATQAFKKALTGNPADHICWLGLGQVFLRTRQYENAVSAFQKSLDIKPDEKRTLLGLAECYLESGKIDAALLVCKQALVLDRNLPEAWVIMSRCHKKKQDYEQAVRDCENILELDDANGTVWNELGNLYLLQKEFEKSVVAYEKAIELKPELGWAYASMALAYEKLGDYSKAILLYQQSVPLFEKNADRAAIWYQLGDVYIHIKENLKAEACFKQSERLLNPTVPVSTDIPFQENIAGIGKEAGEKNISTDQPQSGSELGDELMNESGDNFDILTARDWNELGNSYLRKGAYQEAVQAYTNAIEHAKDMHWPYIKNLAIANYHLGKTSGKQVISSPDPDLWEEDDNAAEENKYFPEIDIPPAKRSDDDTEIMQVKTTNTQAKIPVPAFEAGKEVFISDIPVLAGWNETNNSYF